MDLSIKVARRTMGQVGWTATRAVLGWPARVIQARRAMLQLSRLNSHELKDIGLLPQDLCDVSALSLDADPTLMLAQRARERRRSR